MIHLSRHNRINRPRMQALTALSPLPELPAEHWEREYSPSSAIGGNYQPFIERYARDSAVARSLVPAQVDLRYGPAPRAMLDYFPAPTSQPNPGLLVFIHGGYWQELSKIESAFLAPAWHAAGYAHAVLGYTLAPHTNVSSIVSECRAAISFLRRQAAELGFDASNIVVAGSSAGAYLAAACAADEALSLRGMVPLSGIYDLRPLLHTSINTALAMDMSEATALSHLVKLSPLVPAVISWGEVETAAFKRQSRELADQLIQVGTRCTAFETPARNHFDVVHELASADSPLFKAAQLLFK